MKTIENVTSHEILRYQGDLTITGNIGVNAQILITNGSLIVEGNIDDHASVKIEVTEELGRNIPVNRILGSFSGFVSNRNSIRNITASATVNNSFIGNVNVNNRIFTHDQLTDLGSDNYEITKMDQNYAMMFSILSGSYSSSSSSSASNQVHATVDGVSYVAQHKIRIEGKRVIIDNNRSLSLSDAPAEEQRLSPAKLIVRGLVGSAVRLVSDVAIELNHVGSNCVIKSNHNYLRVGNVGNYTNIYAQDAINAENIGNFCEITSKCNSITANDIGYHVIVNASDAISLKNIGTSSQLTSCHGGLTAWYADDKATMTASDAIKLTILGNDCSVDSQHGGITISNRIGNRCQLKGSETIFLRDMGNNGSLRSKFGNIESHGNLGNHISITASDTVSLKNIGDNCTITSLFKNVSAQNIGRNVTITASSHITISGSSPAPDTCRLTSKFDGNITKPRLAASAPAPSFFMTPPKTSVVSYDESLQPVLHLPAAKQLLSKLSVVKKPSEPIASSSAEIAKPKPAASTLPAIPDSFCCPITFDLMARPVFCVLDGNTYEEAAITRWLSEHRQTPTRINMTEGQRVEDVILLNRSMVNAIEEFKTNNPELFHSSSCRM